MFERIKRELGLPYFPPWAEQEYRDASSFHRVYRMLEFNAYWEAKAIEGYTLHALRARDQGDLKTTEMFDHIRREEEHHLEELLSRMETLGGR